MAFHVRGGGRRQFTRFELFNGFRHLKRPSTFSHTVGSNPFVVRRDAAGATATSRRHHEPALLTTLNERLIEAILEMLSAAPEQRLRPHELKKALAHKLGASRHTVQEAVKNLVEEGHLTFTYRDPTSSLEVPEPAS